MSGGDRHSLWLDDQGQVYSADINYYGQLCDGTTADKNTPTLISTLSNVVGISAGGTISVFLKNDGTVWSCGANHAGQLGTTVTNGIAVNGYPISSVPVQVSSLSNVKKVVAGWYYALALKTDGTVWAFGYNGYCRLGTSGISNSTQPIQVPGLTNIVDIDASFGHSLALKSDGTVWAWGRNAYGQVGNGATIDVCAPVQVLSDAVSISVGGSHSAALKKDNTAWVWGFNQDGGLGVGTTVNVIVPTKLITFDGKKIINIIRGGYSFFAVEDQGSNIQAISAWGGTSNGGKGAWIGYLGIGDTSNAIVTTPTPAFQNVQNIMSISGGEETHTLVIDKDCKAWAAGSNTNGHLGDGTTINRTNLVPVLKNGTQLQLCKTYSNGLVAYYPLDGNGNDASGNNNHLTPQNNPIWTQGKVGQAVSLDGLSYLQKNNFNFYTKDFSVALFARADNVTDWYKFMFALHSGGSGTGQGDAGIGIHLAYASLRPTFTTSDGQGCCYSTTYTQYVNRPLFNGLEASKWYHIVFSRQNGVQKLYIDGVMVSSTNEINVTPDFSLQSGLLEIGAPNYYQGGWTTNGRDTAKWKGLIDEVYLYNRALSDSEITGLYNKRTQLPTKFKLTYNVTGLGSAGASVNFNPIGTSCGTGCMEYAAGTQVSVTPTFDSSLSAFNNFSSTTSSTTCVGNSCSLKMDKDQNVTGLFDKKNILCRLQKRAQEKA